MIFPTMNQEDFDQSSLMLNALKNGHQIFIDDNDTIGTSSRHEPIPFPTQDRDLGEKTLPALALKLPRRVTLEDSNAPHCNITKLLLSQHWDQPQEQRQPPKPTNDKEDAKENTNPGMFDLPTNSDVLCGKSRVCANHPGNIPFQMLLDDFVHQYDIATKKEKMNITKQVVSTIRNSGGRFLKYSYKEGMWQEISVLAARDKVSHAFRTKVAALKRDKKKLFQACLSIRKPQKVVEPIFPSCFDRIVDDDIIPDAVPAFSVGSNYGPDIVPDIPDIAPISLEGLESLCSVFEEC